MKSALSPMTSGSAVRVSNAPLAGPSRMTSIHSTAGYQNPTRPPRSESERYPQIAAGNNAKKQVSVGSRIES